MHTMTITADDILAVTTAVTKKWTKQRVAEERGNRSRGSRRYVYSDRVNFTSVADKILPGAYQHASGDGKYTVGKRQLFYACRDQFREMTGRALEYGYFANTLLVQYLNRHPETASWKITADPRGNLTIPNASQEERIPVGTIQIDNHLKEASQECDPFAIDATLRTEWPSLAEGQRYQAVLYIEKEGFEPILEEARIAERFDLAIMSCKGQSVVAARKFVDRVCAERNGIPLFVVHDFDKAGFEISQRLTSVSDWAKTNDRVTYQFRNRINVIDLGLRLEDVEEYGLAGEPCKFDGHFASDTIATKEEQKFLQGDKRVELNELTAPQFIEWLEAKLGEHLPDRLIPNDDVLLDAYRRALVVSEINRVIEEIRAKAIEKAQNALVDIKSIRQQVEVELEGSDKKAWDKVLYEIAHEGLE